MRALVRMIAGEGSESVPRRVNLARATVSRAAKGRPTSSRPEYFGEVRRKVVDRYLRQVLVQLGRHPVAECIGEFGAQVAQRLRRCDDDQMLEFISPQGVLENGG